MEILATEQQLNYSNLHTNVGQYPSQINRDDFIDKNPNATAKDIYQFAGKIMDDYGGR